MKKADAFSYLTELLSSALNGKTAPQIPENVSFSDVLALAKTHEVANIAYLGVKTLKEPPESDILSGFEQEYYRGVSRNALQESARNEILTALKENKIYSLEVQGTVVKKYYPEPHLRMMSDIDFIVKKEDFNKLNDIFVNLGYQTVSPNGIELEIKKGNVYAELHTEFFDDETVTRPALYDPFSYATLKDGYVAEVSLTVFYLFHLLHTIKHCEQKGSGLRRIVDLFYLEKAIGGKVDGEYIDSVLKKYGFYEQKVKLLAVKDYLFSGITPKEDISYLLDDIKDSGNHGTNELFFKHKFERQKKEGKHFLRLRHLFYRFTMSKDGFYKAYPYLKEHNSNIFVCYVYRIFVLLTNKEKWHNFFGVVREMFSVKK